MSIPSLNMRNFHQTSMGKVSFSYGSKREIMVSVKEQTNREQLPCIPLAHEISHTLKNNRMLEDTQAKTATNDNYSTFLEKQDDIRPRFPPMTQTHENNLRVECATTFDSLEANNMKNNSPVLKKSRNSLLKPKYSMPIEKPFQKQRSDKEEVQSVNRKWSGNEQTKQSSILQPTSKNPCLQNRQCSRSQTCLARKRPIVYQSQYLLHESHERAAYVLAQHGKSITEQIDRYFEANFSSHECRNDDQRNQLLRTQETQPSEKQVQKKIKPTSVVTDIEHFKSAELKSEIKFLQKCIITVAVSISLIMVLIQLLY